MEFPTTFNTLVIPSGAGSGTNRLVIDSNGCLYSFDVVTQRYVEICSGTVLWGHLNTNGSLDTTISPGEINYQQATGLPGGTLPFMTLSSPSVPSGGYDRALQVLFQPGSTSLSEHPTMLVSGTLGISDPADVVISGNVSANNIKSGIASITTVANQWVYTPVVFPNTFASVPAVVLTSHNAGPAAGGTTTLEYAATNVTTTGFNLGVMRSTAVTMDVSWIAASI